MNNNESERINKYEIAELFGLDLSQVKNLACNQEKFPKSKKTPGVRLYDYDRQEIIAFFQYYQDRPSQRKTKNIKKQERSLPNLFHSILNKSLKNNTCDERKSM